MVRSLALSWASCMEGEECVLLFQVGTRFRWRSTNRAVTFPPVTALLFPFYPVTPCTPIATVPRSNVP